ncbi:MAG: phosphate acyltransferase PlsX [Deltaproteobacteria bacterium]|nr:phosphate acyltransferase PlsX [Deltaproteobacteria bacterium]MBW2129356.1 phosphate acyltransferase PlsX [Deltaproteobacteria bacterium]MBW2302317.1 phosphate acyltransferase PlsX [Deltaproteobacteria bacterium]
MKIAVDAMGGDRAPEVVVQGALEAVSEYGIEVVLMGDEQALRKGAGNDLDRPGIKVHHCDDVVFMEEQPMRAVRRKKNASIRVAFEAVKGGEADAVVSAGHSGAMLASAILTLGRLPGVERPAFASIIPGAKGEVILIDVGANVDCRPVHLLQFGAMAHAFAKAFLGIKDPRVGLLSIGREGGKGNEQVRLAHNLFKASPLPFAGNVEGRQLFDGKVQVVVCDGFVGNVVLKVLEGMAETVTAMLADSKSVIERAGCGETSSILTKLMKKRLDYEEYGGAPILGINGVGIVCHGASSSKAVKKAIKMAAEYREKDIPEKLAEYLARFQGT